MAAPRAVRRTLYLVACLAPVWSVIACATNGVMFQLGGLRFKATEPVRPLVIAAVAASLYIWRSSAETRETDGVWLAGIIRRLLRWSIPALILMAMLTGIRWGTFTAAGSDAYGYLSQADLWLTGSLRVSQPWVQQFSLPKREWLFAPLGYRPLSTDGTIVPTYAPGLPMLMALFELVGGRNAPFFVVPLLGACAVWLTFELGKRLVSATVGAFAALLLLTSPVFLAHLLVPMTDVPVTAAWLAVGVLALSANRDRDGRRWAIGCGILAGAALLVRPNLLLLSLIPLVIWRGRRDLAIRYALALVPGVLAILLLNTYLYGSVTSSGYGALSGIFSLGSAWPNLRRYGSWLIQTQTVMVLLALAPVMLPRRSGIPADARVCLGSYVVLTLLSYLFYAEFENWTYLRFLLPAFPALFILMGAATRMICASIPSVARPAVALLIGVACLAASFVFARDQFIFDARKIEQRHIAAANRVAELTPDTAIILCVQHSGSLRYYANRKTLRFDALADDGLDAAIDEIRARGYQPFIVLDDWEEQNFRKQFAARNRAGRLDWPAVASMGTNPDVRIYFVGRLAGS